MFTSGDSVPRPDVFATLDYTQLPKLLYGAGSMSGGEVVFLGVSGSGGFPSRSLVLKRTLTWVLKAVVKMGRVYHSPHHATDGGMQQRDQRCNLLK